MLRDRAHSLLLYGAEHPWLWGCKFLTIQTVVRLSRVKRDVPACAIGAEDFLAEARRFVVSRRALYGVSDFFDAVRGGLCVGVCAEAAYYFPAPSAWSAHLTFCYTESMAASRAGRETEAGWGRGVRSKWTRP